MYALIQWLPVVFVVLVAVGALWADWKAKQLRLSQVKG